jgi:hypothetical protein
LEDIKAAARRCRFCRFDFANKPTTDGAVTDVPHEDFGLWSVVSSRFPNVRKGDDVGVFDAGEDLELLGPDGEVLVALPVNGIQGQVEGGGSISIYSGERIDVVLDPVEGMTDRLVRLFDEEAEGSMPEGVEDLARVLRRYAGSMIGVNDQEPTKYRAARLRAVSDDAITLDVDGEWRHLPLRAVLMVKEAAPGRRFKVGGFFSSAPVPLVVTIFHLVVYKGFVGFSYDFGG